MAISLKNIDDRVRKLESTPSGLHVPDTSKRVEITSSPYTVTQSGFVSMCTSETWSARCYFELNNVRIYGTDSYKDAYYSNINILVPVIPNDKITFKGLTSTVNGVKGSLYFYPAKVILYYFSNIIKSKILHSNISAINNLLVKFISSSPKIFSKGGIEFGY